MKNQKVNMISKKPSLGQYFAKYKIAILFYILVMLVASSSSIAITILSAKGIELITLSVFKKAIIYAFIVLGLSIFQRLMWFIANTLYIVYSNKIMSNLNYDLAKQSFKLNSKTFNDHDTGTFVMRIVNDPEQVVSKYADIIDIITEIITAFVMLVYILTLNSWIALIFVGVLIVGIICERYRVKLRRKNHKIVKKTQDKIHSLTTEIVRSEKDIKSLGLEQKLSEVSEENYVAYRKAKFRHSMTDSLFGHWRNFFIDTITTLALILGIVFIDKGLLTLAAFMVIKSNSNSLYRLIWNAGFISNCIVDIKVSTERMFALFDEKEFVTERFGKTNLDVIKGNIKFKNVSYTFKEYEYEDKNKLDDDKSNKQKKLKKKSKEKPKPKLISENQVFKNLSFKIKPNSTVAFVGKSGSGKSTILNLMSKMYEADSGEVLIDGVNINKLNKQSLRNGISLVNQFPYIFDMTIKENLLLAKGDATDDEIIDSLTKASLREFIDSLPKGIETKVGESGIKLSGGQKQRLAIARALLRKSSIIIFDESTSSLDNFAQEEVKKSIDNLKGKSTIVIVAHRLSTIKNANKIFFLDSGEIVDSGTFEELFERNDKFRAMFLAENI
ncbi:MAG: ABC transporter ATP-binding protein [Clostridia bacterium]|nr:ABC transporter ATP-binding protein [Clostridia bacterium]